MGEVKVSWFEHLILVSSLLHKWCNPANYSSAYIYPLSTVFNNISMLMPVSHTIHYPEQWLKWPTFHIRSFICRKRIGLVLEWPGSSKSVLTHLNKDMSRQTTTLHTISHMQRANTSKSCCILNWLYARKTVFKSKVYLPISRDLTL